MAKDEKPIEYISCKRCNKKTVKRGAGKLFCTDYCRTMWNNELRANIYKEVMKQRKEEAEKLKKESLK